MITISGTKKHFFQVITPLMTASTMGIALPSYGSTITSISQVDLLLDNFNQFPEDVGVVGDVKASTIAEGGSVDAFIDGEATFFAENADVFALSSLQTIIQGIGSDQSARIDILARLNGQFLIPAKDTLSFDLNASIFLLNFHDDPTINASSSLGNIQIFLQEAVTQQRLPLLDLFGTLNTNIHQDLSRDLLRVKLHPNLSLTSYQEQQQFTENQESWELQLTGSFQFPVEEETTLTLVAVTQSCNHSADSVHVCTRIPEPSPRLALILGLFWLSVSIVWSRVVN